MNREDDSGLRSDRIIRHKQTRCSLCKFFFPLLIFSMRGVPEIRAQATMDYTVEANIIYRFTKYIDWPDSKKNGDFIIGIVGESPLTVQLISTIANRTVGSQRIVIRKFSATAEVFNCHILFISDGESGSIKKIVMRTAGNPILLVSESDGLALKGSCINFTIISDHLKLEINKNNIEQRNLNIASELVQLGKAVK